MLYKVQYHFSSGTNIIPSYLLFLLSHIPLHYSSFPSPFRCIRTAAAHFSGCPASLRGL